MKKWLLALLLALALTLTACSTTEYTVRFDQASAGTSIQEQVVRSGKTLEAPAEPTKEGYVFLGWNT